MNLTSKMSHAYVPDISDQPYLGDFTDLMAVGNRLYGIFSALNDTNGNNAFFLTTRTRCFSAITSELWYIVLQNLSTPAETMSVSVDPFFFEVDETPEPGTFA